MNKRDIEDIVSFKLDNLLSNKINWVDVEGIHINFDSFLCHCDLVYFTNRGIPVADVPITKLFCALT